MKQQTSAKQNLSHFYASRSRMFHESTRIVMYTDPKTGVVSPRAVRSGGTYRKANDHRQATVR